MARIIELIVSPQGNTTIQTKGYVAGECLQASKFIEQALGISTSERKTADYYQTAQSVQQIQQQ